MIYRTFFLSLITIIALMIFKGYGQTETALPCHSIDANPAQTNISIAGEDCAIWGTSLMMEESGQDRILAAFWPDTLVTQGEKNTAIIPVFSKEDRAASAGWLKGGTWMDQHNDINEIGKTRKVDLVFLGNSITQSWGGEGRHVASVGGNTWQEYYQNRNAAGFGISGDRTQHILWRIANGNFDAISPKVVVLLIGTNNLNHNSTNEIIAGINAIVSGLQRKIPQSKIVLMGILPRGEKVDDPYRIRIQKINAAIQKNDDQKFVFFIDIGKVFLHPNGNANKNLMANDCLHLKPEGYEAWAKAIEPLLNDLWQR